MVNFQYELKKVQGTLHTILKKNGSVQLLQLFTAKEYAALQKKIMSLPFVRSYQPVTHSFARAEADISFLLPLVSGIVGKKVKKIETRVYCLEWRDYTLLHDKAVEGPGTDIVLDFTDRWNSRWGGIVTYVDGEGNYTRVPAVANMMFVMQRKKEQKFISYLNHKAKGKRYVVIGSIDYLLN